jgi:hypothetical protein
MRLEAAMDLVEESIIWAGRTGTTWEAYTGADGPGIWMRVNTREANFPADSLVDHVCSLNGSQVQWLTTGGSCIYDDTYEGFTVYVRRSDGESVTPAQASEWNWSISWFGRSKPNPFLTSAGSGVEPGSA